MPPGTPQDPPNTPPGPPGDPLGSPCEFQCRYQFNKKLQLYAFNIFSIVFINFQLQFFLCKLALASFYTYFPSILIISQFAYISQTRPGTPQGPPKDPHDPPRDPHRHPWTPQGPPQASQGPPRPPPGPPMKGWI